MYRKDPIPKVQTAGIQTVKNESAESCIKGEVFNPLPSTPEHLKKYRKTF